MNIVVIQREDGAEEGANLATIVMEAAPGIPGDVLAAHSTVERPGGKPLQVSATYVQMNHNLTVLVRYDDEHVFTGMCRWHEVAPYFAFRLKEGDFIELYFA